VDVNFLLEDVIVSIFVSFFFFVIFKFSSFILGILPDYVCKLGFFSILFIYFSILISFMNIVAFICTFEFSFSFDSSIF